MGGLSCRYVWVKVGVGSTWGLEWGMEISFRVGRRWRRLRRSRVSGNLKPRMSFFLFRESLGLREWESRGLRYVFSLTFACLPPRPQHCYQPAVHSHLPWKPWSAALP